MTKPQPGPVPDVFLANGFVLIEFDRRPIDRRIIRGFVVDWNPELTMIHVMEDHTYRLNGFAVFRSRDVHKWRAVPKEDFLARAALMNELVADKPAGISIANWKDAVQTAGDRFPLISLYREQILRGAYTVGKVLGVTQRSVKLKCCGSQAEWEGQTTALFRDITMLEFGGAYESLMSRMTQ